MLFYYGEHLAALVKITYKLGIKMLTAKDKMDIMQVAWEDDKELTPRQYDELFNYFCNNSRIITITMTTYSSYSQITDQT